MATGKEIDRRFTAMQLQVDQRFEASRQAVAAALRANEIAINKAEDAAERRFASVNEFRQTLTDQTANFVTRDRFDGLDRRLTLLEGTGAGAERSVLGTRQQAALVISALSALIAVAAIIVVIILHR